MRVSRTTKGDFRVAFIFAFSKSFNLMMCEWTTSKLSFPSSTSRRASTISGFPQKVVLEKFVKGQTTAYDFGFVVDFHNYL